MPALRPLLSSQGPGDTRDAEQPRVLPGRADRRRAVHLVRGLCPGLSGRRGHRLQGGAGGGAMSETARVLMKGNEAIAEAAIRAGVRAYFGYPITPQSEISEYMARRLPERGGVFLQAESEVAAINMVYGAAGAGARVMTSTSSPGISLMQEGSSYIVGSELPCVVVNIMRGGPGLGNIAPSQADYFQATKSAGHGDGRNLVLAPSTIQEAADLTLLAFDLADRYRNPVMIPGDGYLGQMMEPVTFPDARLPRPAPEWSTTGAAGGAVRLINSIYLEAEALEAHNLRLQEKYRRTRTEVRF